MEITAIYDSTEYHAVVEDNNNYTKFIITKDSLEIQSLNERSITLSSTEIEIKDAIQLANLIITLNK